MRVLAVLTMALVTAAVQAEDKVDTSKLEGIARSLGQAFLAGEYAKFAEYTHPRVIEGMGGKEKMIEAIEKGMKQLKEQGYSFEKYNVGKPEAPFVDGKTAYVVVPTSLRMKAPGATIESDSYLLAISEDKGKTWTFADGAGMSDPVKRKKFFPNLPEGLKLPARKTPKITKD